MSKNKMYVLSPEGRHLPTITCSSLLDRFGLRELWDFCDELCDSKEFEKIAQLLIFYISKKVEANGWVQMSNMW